MTALRAALGAVAGGLEGAQQAEALRRKQKLDEEAATRQSAMDQIALADKGFVERGVREGLVRQATPAIGNALRTATAAMSGNLADARPVDFSALGKAAGMYGDTPAASVALGGKTFERMQTPMQASLMAAEQEATQARGLRQEVAKEEAQKASAAAQAKSVEMAAMKSAWMAAGLPDAMADVAARTGAKYGDVMMSEKDMQTLGISRGQLKLAQDRFQFDQGKAAGETPQGELMNGLQAMGKTRASTALNLLETNTKIMKQFEDDLRDGKLQMTGVQLEAARKALAGTPGSAIAEEALNKGNLLIDKNPALLRYIRAGKSIATAVREITPRGGSNALMQMEFALSGIGPGGTDPESLAQVDAFRNDLLMGVRAGVEAMTGKRSGGTEGVRSLRGEKSSTQPSAAESAMPSARPPLSSFKR